MSRPITEQEKEDLKIFDSMEEMIKIKFTELKDKYSFKSSGLSTYSMASQTKGITIACVATTRQHIIESPEIHKEQQYKYTISHDLLIMGIYDAPDYLKIEKLENGNISVAVGKNFMGLVDLEKLFNLHSGTEIEEFRRGQDQYMGPYFF